MAAGVTDRLWDVNDLVALWESYEWRADRGSVIEMSLRSAFFIAVVTGVIVGAAAGRFRKILHRRDETPFPAALYSGVWAAFIFGAAVACDGIAQFMLWEHSATPPRSILEFTVFAIALFALVLVLYE
jgi:uncharacterized membrane protein